MAPTRKTAKTSPKPESDAPSGGTQSYSLEDLTEALVMAERTKSHEEARRAFFAARSAAMLRAFGIERQGDDLGRERFGPFLRETVEAVAGTHSLSPFAGLAEAPMAVANLYKQFAGPIEQGVDAFRAPLLKMLVVMLEQLVAVRSVSGADLLRCGFDPATPEPAESSWWD